jgi:hypothetical protein
MFSKTLKMNIFLSAISISLAASASAQTVGRTVVDGSGKFVGLLVSSGLESIVERKINDQWIAFHMGTEGFASGFEFGNSSPLFTDNHCSGHPYIAAETTPSLGSVFAPDVPVNYYSYYAGFETPYVLRGTLVYPSIPFTRITVASYLGTVTSLSPLTGTCYTSPLPPQPVIAGSMSLFNLGPFTPPLSVQ